jgi:hypothetical protein
MNKPTILSLGAMASVLIALAIPSYNSLQQGKVVSGYAAKPEMVSGKYWHCVSRTGPDAPNLIVLRDYGQMLKLIDHNQTSGNGTDYDLQGRFDITQDRLVAHLSSASGNTYTDTYTVKQLEPDKMLMLQTSGNPENSAAKDTRYNCSTLASRS